MQAFLKYMNEKLIEREQQSKLRGLEIYSDKIDFSSNDYLGIAKANNSGSTGSRLISGNNKTIENLEIKFSRFVNQEESLLFHSGFQANIGLIPAITPRGSTIIYDELIHASLRDGIRLSNANSFYFKHNNLEHLKERLDSSKGLIFIIIESVYSMDGDSPNLIELIKLSQEYSANVIVDEAHALGIAGRNGAGLIHHLKLSNQVLATIYPLGKALGSSGAFISGSSILTKYLINYCRSFIYSTSPSNTIVNEISSQLDMLINYNDRNNIFRLKKYFLSKIDKRVSIISGEYGAIVSVLISDQLKIKEIEHKLLNEDFFVKAILHPTVAKGKERLRICFHSYNTDKEIDNLVYILNSFN